MLDPDSYRTLQASVLESVANDQNILDELREEIRSLRGAVRRIQTRSTTSMSLVAADGGNNTLHFDPFLVQLVRVVDSSNNEYCLEVVTPTTPLSLLQTRHFDAAGQPISPLGRMMAYLGVLDVSALSPMIRPPSPGRPVSPSWVQVYRELTEWAILFSIVRTKDFATDTLIVFDGLLRSKVFAKDLFKRYLDGLEEGIARHYQEHRRQLFLVGVAKHSKVLSRYRLAMALEDLLTTDYPAYVEVPRDIEEKAYTWAEYARGNDREADGTEPNRFVGGKLFFVKFGSAPRDPIWPVDVFLPQVSSSSAIFGYLLADALNGFPVPLYPQCLQRAHENAALVDFDMDVLQDEIIKAVRTVLGFQQDVVDVFQLQDADPAHLRYQ